VTRCVIVHDEMGIFVGCAMGCAFWSNLDAAGQYTVVSFEDQEDARDFAEDVFGDMLEFDDFRYVTVDTNTIAVGIDALTRAGLGRHIGTLVSYEYH